MIAKRTRQRAGIALAALLLAVGASACGKPAVPKVDPESERAEAEKRAREGPYGAQLKGLDTAKGLESDLNKKAQDAVEKAEKDAK
ncbi:MAG TPA: hypothetical protein VN878_04630 [Usitatibacter sp.]|nr:hypothetical protein [Usitatibacter sp.]